MYTETRSLEIKVENSTVKDWLTSALNDLMYDEAKDLAPLEEALFRIGFGGILSFDYKEKSKPIHNGREITVEQTYITKHDRIENYSGGKVSFRVYCPHYEDHWVMEYEYDGDKYQIRYDNRYSTETELYVIDPSGRRLTRKKHNCKYDD